MVSADQVFGKRYAAQFAALDIPVFACTPNQFPDLMAAALNKSDLKLRARGQGIKMGWEGSLQRKRPTPDHRARRWT